MTRALGIRRQPLLCALLVWTCCLLHPAARVHAARLLAPQAQPAEPLSNVVQPQLTTDFQQRASVLNDTLLAFQLDVAVRIKGAQFVPLTRGIQGILVKSLDEVFVQNHGPLEITSYREVYPDPAAPDSIRDRAPAVDVMFTVHWVAVRTVSWDAATAAQFPAYQEWVDRFLELGGWDNVSTLQPPLQLLFANSQLSYFQGGFILHPIIVMKATLAVNITDASGLLSAEQASVVSLAVERAIVSSNIGRLVEVVDYTNPVLKSSTLAADTQIQSAVQLEVSMFMCRDDATVASPECEQQVLGVVLAQLLSSTEALQEFQAAGIQSIQLVEMRPRQPPTPPPNTTLGPQPWVPWHLDRLDQRALPLDGQFMASASGTGVHVYIISSGIRGDHEEFLYLGGGPGSRAKPEWGFMGLKPLEDCPDAFWYGYGTFAASLCCGLRLGAAKNATIHSVRFRESCKVNPLVWSAGALPAALDEVLENYTKPAVVVIDTWWSPATLTGVSDNPEFVEKQLTDRLSALGDANITIIAAAGPGLNLTQTACDNVIASHPAVISVAASDTHDQVTALGPRTSSCIDIYAPSGGLGVGLTGAHPTGHSDYITIINRAYGSAAVLAGVAAQYLQLHPRASPSQVRQALLDMGTQHVVAGAAPESTTALLHTNLTEPPVGSVEQLTPEEQHPRQAPPAQADTSSGLSTGGVAGIAVGICVAVAVATMVGWAFVARRRRKLTNSQVALKSFRQLDKLDSSGWKIDQSEIEICRQPDGAEWLLGEGQYGKVFKAVKGGVQEVAVKTLNQVNEEFTALFLKEVAMMKYVSRDANITQFFGACVQGNNLMLVAEYMEGGDLRTAISSDQLGSLQWYQRGKGVMLDVVKGVVFLHASNVIHRDIKSKNILLDRHGRAKLADVGLAQIRQAGQEHTSEGFVGTLTWAGPEVLLGDKCTEKADMYSLGVVLWELVTGEMPQRGRMRDPEVPGECPQAVADAIVGCMQQDPNLRPSARELYSILVACPPCANHKPTPSPSAAVGSETDTSLGVQSREMSREASRETSIPSNNLWSGGMEWRQLPRTSSKAESQSYNTSSSDSSLLPADLAPMLTFDFSKVEFCQAPGGARQTLGSGGFGAVYKVLVDGVQPLAAKVVDLGQDPRVHSTFIQEAGLLWRLRHRNLVGLSGVSISEGRGYLLMELMEGGSLYKMLNIVSKSSNKRMFAWQDRGKQVALEVARGMHYLHSLRITHFDIKSGNILLTKELNAKLADVGLARVMVSTHHSLSHSGSLGTFSYMAPELLSGSKCTESVDIYSFGILLWEICTGTHPVRGRMQQELRVPQDCPQAVVDLYHHCTAANPAQRPTAKEVVARLLRIEEEEQLRGPEPRTQAPKLHPFQLVSSPFQSFGTPL